MHYPYRLRLRHASRERSAGALPTCVLWTRRPIGVVELGLFVGGKIRIAHDVGRRIGHRAAKSSRLTGSNGSSFPNLRQPLPRSPPARSTGGRTHPPTWLGSSPPIPTSWSKIPTRSAAWDCCGFPEARPRIPPLPSGNAGGSDNPRPGRGRLPDVRLNRGHMIQTMHHSPGPRLSPISEPSRPNASCPESERGVLLCPGRLCGVEFPAALFDAASPFVSGKDDADVVWASAFACSGDFLLRFAGCQGEDLIPQGRRAALAASWFSGRSTPASAWPRWSSCFCCCRRRLRCRHLCCPGALGVAREHTFGRFQSAELVSELVALRIDACERLADPLLLLGDLVEYRHSVPSRQSIG